MKRLFSKMLAIILSSAFTVCSYSNKSYAINDSGDELWKKFLKYDLCISDYNALTPEEHSLCQFIFDTEREHNDFVRCERARRTLAHDPNLGERIRYDELDSLYGVRDFYAAKQFGYAAYRHCVPDLIYTDGSEGHCEFWLDDAGTYILTFDLSQIIEVNGRGQPMYLSGPVTGYLGDMTETLNAIFTDREQQKRVNFYEEDGVPYFSLYYPVQYVWRADSSDTNLSDYLDFHEIDGDIYYFAPDGTAVFWYSKYAHRYGDTSETISANKPVTVPESVDGRTITMVAEHAFFGASVTEVILPDTVWFIGNNAFQDCTSLVSVRFPKALRLIPLYGDIMLQTEILTLDCPDLKLAGAVGGSLKELNLDAAEIIDYAISGCGELKTVSLGEHVRKICPYAFKGQTSLQSLTLPGNLEIIGQGAFLETGLKEITIPPSVRVIGAYTEFTGIPAALSGFPSPEYHPLTDEPVCAFEPDCVIYGYAGTEAERYAAEWNLAFHALESVRGDLNYDETLSVADAVLFTDYLLHASDRILNWKAADFNADNKLDARDLTLIKRELIHGS